MLTMALIKNILVAITRRKTIESSFESPLRRCLTFWDLFLLGVGGSVDVALYVVLGNVIRDFCGPAIMISMIIGFFLCFTSGLCYAEFASHVPTSGSDYDYIYSTLGELFGFLDGWSILVSSVLATASLAQGAADLLRSLTDSATFDHLDGHAPLPDHAILSSNVNIVAAAIVVLVTIITALGVQSSVRINDAIVSINLLVVIFTFILGCFYINFENWSGWANFAPHGIDGILKSIPYTIFFFCGFVSVTYSTEEVIDAHKILPRSIMASLIGIFVCFFIIGFVLSLVIPYHQLSEVSPLSDAFEVVAFKQSKYIIAFGGFCSCFSSVLTTSYANSRLTYVISRDGLLMKYLRKVNRRFFVPVRAVLITGGIATVLAAFVNLTILIEICSILMLLPYVALCVSVILLRYEEAEITNKIINTIDTTNHHGTQPTNTKSNDADLAAEKLMSGHPPLSQTYVLSGKKTKTIIIIALVILFICSASVSLVVRFGISYELETSTFITLGVIFTIPILVSTVIINRTPRQVMKFPFTMPMFPLLPTSCFALCTFVMFQFSTWAWILFAVNTTFGLIIYFGYGMKNSKVKPNTTEEYVDLTESKSPHLLT